ncbi:MAG: arylformamidase [Calditrichia bacterium]
MIFDITRTIGKDTLTYPGDKPASITRNQFGDITTSRLAMSSHTGTHLDAPRHFIPDGKTLDEYSVQDFMLMAAVVEWNGVRDQVIEQIKFIKREHPKVEAILFRTANSEKARNEFERDFQAIDEEIASLLVEMKFKLVGIDYLSIEKFDTEDYPVHHILLNAGLLILEDVDLRMIEKGIYQLIVLPLKWDSADGAPARAVLIKEEN